MKKLGVLLMSIILLLSCSSFVYADNSDVQQEVQNVANKSLDFAKEKFTEAPEKWGFNKGDDISNITLGDGYRLRYLDEDKLKDSSSNNLMDVTFESDFWQYIIYLNDEPQTYLTVGLEDGEYKMVQLGGNAQDLDATLTNFNSLAIKTVNDTKPIMAKIQGNYFLILQNTDNTELVLPLIIKESAKGFANMDNTTFKSSEEIVKLLRANYQGASSEIQYGANYGGSDIQNSISGENSVMKLLIVAISVLLIAGISIVLYRRKSMRIQNK